MGDYLLLLLILACPLLMICLMRGIHCGHDMSPQDTNACSDVQIPRVDLTFDQSILDQERQVAELRAERDSVENAARQR